MSRPSMSTRPVVWGIHMQAAREIWRRHADRWPPGARPVFVTPGTPRHYLHGYDLRDCTAIGWLREEMYHCRYGAAAWAMMEADADPTPPELP